MNNTTEKIIVDEIDIINSGKFIRTLSNGIILKKYIDKNSFNQIKSFLKSLADTDSQFLKDFLDKYEKYQNALPKID